MSEPYSAFVRLRITRLNLLRWLGTPPSRPARWRDWRVIGGSWYLPAGIKNFAQVTDADATAIDDDAWLRLSRWPTAREALRGLIRGGDGEAFYARRFTYDAQKREFDGGSLFFDEGLDPFLAFLALVRGSEDVLGPDDAGVAVIHDYAFAPNDQNATVAAMVLGPGRCSRLSAGAERSSAVGAFQSLADAMLAQPDKLPPPVDHHDEMR